MENNIVKVNLSEIDFEGKTTTDIVALVNDLYAANNLSAKLELSFIQFLIADNYVLRKTVESNPASLYNAVMQAASMGLSFNPQLKEAYFAPYSISHFDEKTKKSEKVATVTMSPMWRGRKKMLIKSGAILNIETELVYKDEPFDISIIDGKKKITHKPNYFNRENHKENIIGGYAIITLPNGEIQVLPKGRDYFDRAAKQSKEKMNGKESPAWKNWFDGMCRKCLINAADGEITKENVSPEMLKVMTDIETLDIDHVDVTEQKQIEAKAEKKFLSEKEYKALIDDLELFKISREQVKQKYSENKFTKQQGTEIAKLSDTEARIGEIAQIVADGTQPLEYFEYWLTTEQKMTVKDAAVDINMP